MLGDRVVVTRDRDTRVRAAVATGLTRHRIHLLTGIGQSAIDRSSRPLMGHLKGHLEAAMIIDTRPGTSPVRRSAWSVAEARGFEPRMGANPNRISSAAP
jgi:hypothetical protein